LCHASFPPLVIFVIICNNFHLIAKHVKLVQFFFLFFVFVGEGGGGNRVKLQIVVKLIIKLFINIKCVDRKKHFLIFCLYIYDKCSFEFFLKVHVNIFT